MGLSPAQTAIRAAAGVNKAAARLEDTAPGLDLEATARALHAAEVAKAEWSTAIDALKARAYDLLCDAGHQYDSGVRYDGLPPLKTTVTGATVRWDGARAASVVAARTADECANPLTGEIMPLGAICERVAQAIVDCAGLTPSKQWREGSLRARGIDPEPLREKEGGRRTVRWDR